MAIVIGDTEHSKEEDRFIILGFRKLDGICLAQFYDKYKENMQDIFPIKPLIKSGELIFKDGRVFVNHDKFYVMNEILIKLI